MDKQNMNLEQLYKERFQSFEMEQDSRINLRMRKKIRHFKTMQWVKWIAIGLLISTVAVIISLWSLNTKDIHSQTLAIQAKTLKMTVPESADLQNPQAPLKTYTGEMPVEEIPNPMIDHKPPQHLAVRKDIKTEQGQNMNSKEDLLLSQDVFEVAKPASDNARLSVSKSDSKRRQNEPSIQFTFLEPRYQKDIAPPKVHKLELNGRDLIPGDHYSSVTKNKKSGLQTYSENLDFDNHSSPMDLFMDIHFSPLLWNNSAKVNDIGMVSDWTSSLHHTAQLSYEMGFSFQLHHQKTPLFLQIGLDYQILKEKIDHRLSHTYEDPELSSWNYDSIFDIQTVMDTFFIIIDSNQFVIDTLFTQDTLLTGIDSSFKVVMTTEEKSKKQVNTYTYLNIPLMLGYEFNTQNNRWSFQVLGGGALAINLSNEGYYYRGGDDFETYSGKVSPSLIWSLQAAANINYQWKKWQFYLQPEFQYQLNESKVYEFAPSRKYQFYKLKAGIRFQLF